MTEVGDLLHLQGIDSEIGAATARIGQIQAILELNEEVEQAAARTQESRSALQELERQQRRLEAAIEDLSARIAPDEKRLYDGSIKNPKELSALQQELEHLRTNRGGLEDQVLELMERVDGAREESARAGAELAERDARWKAESGDLAIEKRTLEARVEDLSARRSEARARVPAAGLARYDALRERKGGVAVVSVRAGACGGCRVMLPDAVRRRSATSAEPVHCPNCERILATAG